MKKVLLVLGIGLLLSIVAITLVAVSTGDRTPSSTETPHLTCEELSLFVEQSSSVSERFGPGLTQLRPYFGPTQIRDVSGITIGKVYLLHGRYSTRLIVPLEAPYQKKDGNWWFKGLWQTVWGESQELNLTLEDSGVLPYLGGSKVLWNGTNWLEPAEGIHPDDLPCLPSLLAPD